MNLNGINELLILVSSFIVATIFVFKVSLDKTISEPVSSTMNFEKSKPVIVGFMVIHVLYGSLFNVLIKVKLSVIITSGFNMLWVAVLFYVYYHYEKSIEKTKYKIITDLVYIRQQDTKIHKHTIYFPLLLMVVSGIFTISNLNLIITEENLQSSVYLFALIFILFNYIMTFLISGLMMAYGYLFIMDKYIIYICKDETQDALQSKDNLIGVIMGEDSNFYSIKPDDMSVVILKKDLIKVMKRI